MLIKLSPDGAPGGDGPEPAARQTKPDEPPATPPAAPPPAAEIVVKAPKSERELELEKELDEERAGRKKDQVRVSELEDENHRLKEIPRPEPARRKKSSGPISHFLGWEED